MQKYFIKIMTIYCNFSLEIDAEYFNTLKSSRAVLDNALAIEEKYAILINNYIEIEKQVVNEIIGHMATSSIECQDDFNIHLALNVKLVNLLTSGRLYQDQAPRHIRSCLPGLSDALKKANNLFSHEYDHNFHFRFMCALRNYVQHNGIPVHKGSRKTRWKNDHLEYSLSLSASRSEIIHDNTFKTLILEEMPDEVDLRSASRSYIESMSNVHENLRKMINESVNNSRLNIEKARDDFKEKYPDKDIDFLAACEYQDEHLTEKVSLFLDWDDIRKKLIARNKPLKNLSKSYIVS